MTSILCLRVKRHVNTKNPKFFLFFELSVNVVLVNPGMSKNLKWY